MKRMLINFNRNAYDAYISWRCLRGTREKLIKRHSLLRKIQRALFSCNSASRATFEEYFQNRDTLDADVVR